MTKAFCAVLAMLALTANAPAAPRGFTLHSVQAELPQDSEMFSGGKDADAINGNCLSCHSAAMVMTQPKLPASVWQAEVTKMIKVYKAPVAEGDIPAILAYLNHLTPGT